jgi:threonine synthase
MSDGIERMLHATLGSSVAKQFREKCEQKQNFTLDDVQHNSLRDVYFGSVVSKSRINGIISSVYRSNDYILDPRTALCHGGLQDYRSKTGVSRVTLLFADDTPLNFCEQITNATGMDTRILADRIRSF